MRRLPNLRPWGSTMRIALVAAVNPQIPSASGVQSYVSMLGTRLASMGQEVELLGLGLKRSLVGGVEVVPIAREVRNAFEFVVALSRHLKRWGDSASIIHAQRPDDLIPFHLMKPATKKVITLHGDHGIHVRSRRGRAQEAFYRVGERYSLMRTHSILCVSKSTKIGFGSRYPLLAAHLRVIPAGIDLDMFHPRDRGPARTELGIPEGDKLVIYVGRFEPEKNPISIVEQFSGLRERHRDARLLLIGDGQLSSDLRRRAGSSGGSIRVEGPVGQDRLAILMAASDLLVLASKHEGLPTVALEALATGIPVVGPGVGILPEVVIPGVNGFLASTSLDLESLMEKALYDSSWDPSTCRSSVRVHGWDKVAPAILEVYRDIAS